MRVSVLPACLSVYQCMPHILEFRRCHLPWDWSYRELRATMWVLGMRPSALQPNIDFFKATMLEICEDTFVKWRNSSVNLGLNS